MLIHSPPLLTPSPLLPVSLPSSPSVEITADELVDGLSTSASLSSALLRLCAGQSYTSIITNPNK
jgi:hypothetical protein